MTETPAAFPNSDIPKIIPDIGTERLKMDVEKTYLEKNIIDGAVFQKLGKKDVYKKDMHKI